MADPGPCALAVLAAGGSSRMGQAKQLLDVDGEPLIRRVVSRALEARMDPTLVILGAHADEVRSRLRGLCVHPVDNTDWREGLSSSLRLAVETLEKWPQARGLIVVLGDQPGMTAAHLRSIDAAQRASGRPIIASDYGDHLGPPAYFDRRVFPELRALRGDVGARALMRAGEIASVPAPSGAGADLDTPADYEHFRGPS